MIVPILHCEAQTQLHDLIRFDASKSLAVKGSVNPINSVKIKPGADASEIEVFDANPKNRYLDFIFSQYAFDIYADNDVIKFETNGITYTTNVLTGTYSLANLLTQIKNAMEAVASPLLVTFAVDERNRITLNPSQPLKVLPNTTSKDLWHHIGFKDEGQLVSYPVEYGLRKVTLTVASISESATITQAIEVYTKDGDAIFSEDADLVAFENDIMKWLPQGRGSFIDLHRRAQRLILDWCDRQGYRDDNQKKITKWAFIDNTDVRMWATYLVLKLFFMGVQNSTDDVFKKKADYYSKLEIEARDRAVLSLDLDGDSKKDVTQGPDIRSGRLFFR